MQCSPISHIEQRYPEVTACGGSASATECRGASGEGTRAGRSRSRLDALARRQSLLQPQAGDQRDESDPSERVLHLGRNLTPVRDNLPLSQQSPKNAVTLSARATGRSLFSGLDNCFWREQYRAVTPNVPISVTLAWRAESHRAIHGPHLRWISRRWGRLFQGFTCKRGRHPQWQVNVGCDLAVDAGFRDMIFVVARSCPRCGVVEILE